MEEIDFIEYQNQLLKRYSKKKGKIRNSWGSKYIHRSIDKNHIIKKVNETTFLHIIRTINEYLSEELASGTPIRLPYIGTFYIAKKEKLYHVHNDVIYNDRKINWLATHKLWFVDKEAEKEKTLVRYTDKTIYQIIWEKTFFTNRSSYKFRACRALQAKLKQNLKNNIEVFAYDR